MAISRLFSSSMSSILGRIAGGAWVPAIVLTSGSATAICISELDLFDKIELSGSGFDRLLQALQMSSTRDWTAFIVVTMAVAYVVQFSMPSLVRFFAATWWHSRVDKRSLRARAAHNAKNRTGDQLEHEAALLEKELRDFPISRPEVKTGTLLGNVIEKAETDAGFQLGIDYQVHAPMLQALAARAGSDPTEAPRLEIETMVANTVAFLFSGSLFLALSREPASLVLGGASLLASVCSYRLSISAARRYVLAARSLVLLHQRDLLTLWGHATVGREAWKSTFEILNTLAVIEEPPGIAGTTQNKVSA